MQVVGTKVRGEGFEPTFTSNFNIDFLVGNLL